MQKKFLTNMCFHYNKACKQLDKIALNPEKYLCDKKKKKKEK